MPRPGNEQTGAKAEDRALQSFVLTEYLDHDWSRELVFFPLENAVSTMDAEKFALVDHADMEIPFQTVGSSITAARLIPKGGQALDTSNENGQHIAFLVDLPAEAQQTYKLVQRAPGKPFATDLQWEESESSLRLWNSLTGLEAPTSAGSFSNGPIASIRLRSGKWAGGSRLVTDRKIDSYEATVLARGPVFGEIECKYTFEGGKTWTIRFRVIAGEPVIGIDEQFNLTDKSRWEFSLTRNFSPNAFAFRNTDLNAPGRKHNGSTVTLPDPKKPEHALSLDPWLAWWKKDNVSFFGAFTAPTGIDYVYSVKEQGPVQVIPPNPDKLLAEDTNTDDMMLEDDNRPLTTRQHHRNTSDVFFAAAGNSSFWAEPGKKDGPGKSVIVKTTKNGEVFLNAQLNGPGRKWIFGSSTVAETVKPDSEMAEPQHYFIKYCITPLNQLAAMKLEWKRDLKPFKHPWVFIDEKDIPRARERFPDTEKWAGSTKKLYWDFIYNPTTETKAAMKKRVLASLHHYVNNFTSGRSWRGEIGASPYKGTVHFCKKLVYLLFEVDLAFGQDIFSAEERDRICSQLAFLAYKAADPDYYDLSRDFRANPNMTTQRHAAVGLYACMLKDHPKAGEWYDLAWNELDSELNEFSGPNGGWIESPHYQTVSHVIILLQKAAYKAGLCPEPYDKRMLRSIMYMAKISTPRDQSFHGLRHFPAVGDTPRYALSMIYSVMAKAMLDRDPESANALQWTWYEQGRPLVMGIGGDCIANYFAEFIVADFEPRGPPAWTSELFPLGCAVLRSGFPSDRETHMHLYGGMIWSHYSNDNGSFLLYGKGQPLVLDWGYKGIMPAWWHSKVNLTGLGYFQEFSAQPDIDYVRYEYKRGDTWQRQVLLVKDKDDPLGPNYYLMRDLVEGKGKKDEWYLWLNTAKAPMANGDVAQVTGTGDVDLDVWFCPPWIEKIARIDAEEALFVNNPGRGPEIVNPGVLTEADDLTLDEDEKKELSPLLKTRAHSYGNATGVLREGNAPVCYRYGAAGPALSQKSLTLKIDRGQPLLWLLYPRMREQKHPAFTNLDGQGVKVESAQRTDYVFLSYEPVTYAEGEIAFEGKAGAILVSKDKVVLSLAAAGTIRYGDKSLTADKAATRLFAAP